MTVDERIEKLEQELAELRKCIRTQHIIIEDDKGQSRADLKVGENGPALGLYDINGKVCAYLSGDKNGPWAGLVLVGEFFDSVIMTTSKDGPSLVLCSKRGVGRAILATDKDGPRLVLRDENRKDIWQAPPK
jgi:hypothetical protein